MSRSKKSRYLELALVALAEIPEADAEGVFPLDQTQYDMINEGTEDLHLGSCRIPNLAEFQKHSAEEKRNPYPQNICFRFSEPVFVLHSRTFHF